MSSQAKRYLFLILHVALVCALLPATPAFAQAPSKTSWQLQLERLRVAQAQESSGDEPYFVVIHFSTRYLTPGSSTVNFNSGFSTAWITDMNTNTEKDIPADMGLVTFPDVEIITRDDFSCRHIMPQGDGVIVVAMEHDLTPWNYVRGIVTNLQGALQSELQKLVEQGDFNLNDPEPDIRAAVGRIMDKTLPSLMGSIEILLASLGDPDDFIGYHLFLLGAADPRVKVNLAIPTIDQVTLNTFEPFRFAIGTNPLVFEGDGARYEVTAALTKLGGPQPQAPAGLTLTYNSPATTQFPTLFTAQVAKGSGVTYDWTWGDGTKSSWCAAASHTFAAPGVYPVTVTASSYGQPSSSQSLSVTVTTVQPTAKIFLPVIQR